MSAAFEATVAADLSAQTGHIQGDELRRLSDFLRASPGVPLFDVEYDGKLYHRCVVTGGLSGGSIHFTFDWVGAPDVKSSPLR